MLIAETQGVLEVSFDAFDILRKSQNSKLSRDYSFQKMDIFMDWLGHTSRTEQIYKHQRNIILKLSKHFKEVGLRMTLLKGLGLSYNYPNPNHRPTGDIDLYYFGKGKAADDLVKDKLGIEVKQNEEKHSTYDIEGIHVENHATIICELEHPSLAKVEIFLEQELSNFKDNFDTELGCYLPSNLFNAVYLPLHFGSHFVNGGANFRQIVDYGLMVKNANLTPID